MSKRLFTVFALGINMINCKSQILPLSTALPNIQNGAHVKDLNNELNAFVGVYKAFYNGNETTLYITKVEDKLEKSVGKSYFLDAIVVKYIVKDSSSQILQDTQNNITSSNLISSYRIRTHDNTMLLIYEGTNCGVGWGSIYLKKINATQLQWKYRPEDTAVGEDCPSSADLNIYLPETDNLIFTKQ